MRFIVIMLFLIGSVKAGKTLPPLDPKNVECKSDRVIIKIPFSVLTDLRAITNVHISRDEGAYDPVDAACVAVERTTEKDWYFDLDLTGDGIKCAKAGSGDTAMSFTFVVHVQPFFEAWLSASYSPKVNYVVVCNYLDTVGQKTPENTLSPSKGSQAFKIAAATKDFEISVKYFPDGFAKAAAAATDVYQVEVGKSVNIQCALKSDYWNDLVLQAKSCVLSPYADPAKTPHISVIKDWCRVDDILTGNLNGVVKNSVDKHVNFYFSTFFWSALKSSSIYVHCDLFVCSTKAGDTCTKTCAKRTRRSTDDKDEEDSEGKIVTLGPFNITSGESRCDDPEKYGCEQGCVNDANGVTSCTCTDEYRLADDLKSCQRKPQSFYHFYQINKFINIYTRPDSQTAAVAIVTLILILTIAFLVYRIRKTRGNKWNHL